MFSKINILGIVKDHIATMKNHDTEKTRYFDLIVFFYVPILISSVIFQFCPILGNGIPNALLISLSVFTALMLNLLMLIFNIMQNTKNNHVDSEKGNKKIKIDFLKEIYYNISFSILISLCSVIILILYSIGVFEISIDIKLIFTLLTYYLIFIFILTIFMILKRVHVLISKEFDED